MSKSINIIPLEENSESFFNIVPASEFIPEWYRNSDSKVFGTRSELNISDPSVTTSTYKKCMPFFDALTLGYMVFLTADLEVTRKEDGMPYIMWRTDRTMVTEHTMVQWDGLPCPEGYSPFVYKWHNQFSIKTPKDYSLLFLSPINRFDLPFTTVTGIVDTDLYDLNVHFPFFIKKDFEGIIKKGTPITQIIPVKRDSWKREYDVYNKNKVSVKLEKFLSTIKRSYKNNYWVRKEYR